MNENKTNVPETTSNPSWNDAAIRGVIDSAKKAGKLTGAEFIDRLPVPSRNFIAVGMGDGGCNIAAAIGKALPSVFTIGYNTSNKGMTNLHLDAHIYPDGEDGSGKARSYSQDVFRQAAHKTLIATIQQAAQSDKMINLEYILVITTVAGGTGGGTSPMAAKFIADNMNVPVIIMGVYPNINEDTTALYNTMAWQDEVLRTGLPYIILDNTNEIVEGRDSTSIFATHEKVNAQAVEIVNILAGKMFGETNITAIDNRDMYMLLQHIGGRIAVYGTVNRPGVGKSLDEMLLNVFTKWNQPVPTTAKGIGLFLKGPEDMIRNADTSLTKLRSIFGDFAVQYTHLEVSDEVYVALVCSGCDVPEGKLRTIRQKYDEMLAAVKTQDFNMTGITSGIKSPLGDTRTSKVKSTTEIDLSALDL